MNKRPTILVTRAMPDAVSARASQGYVARLNEPDIGYGPDELVARAEGADAIIGMPTDRYDADLISRLPASVRILATFSVGYEHIDTAAAKDRGLVVTNTPDVLTDATADITLLCLLGAARRAYEGERTLRERRWSGWSTTQLCGVQVTGKRLGILGMGRIGRAVAQRARGFEMTIHYSNRSRLPAKLESGAIFHQDPEAMLPHCDFLSINCPASPETHHFLNTRRIALLPDGAVVVNTARGPVVEDEALIEALTSGKLSAAGLDVFEGEPNINEAYYGLDNAFLLPHMGSATIETRNAMGFKCLDNLDAYFAGREPPDRVA